jgi:hypothetical protein
MKNYLSLVFLFLFFIQMISSSKLRTSVQLEANTSTFSSKESKNAKARVSHCHSGGEGCD